MKNSLIFPKITKAVFIPKESLQCFDENNLTLSRYVTEYELILFEQPGGYFFVNGKKYPIFGHDMRLYRPGDYVYSYRFYDVYVIHFTIGKDCLEACELNQLPAYFADVNYEKMLTLFQGVIQSYINHNMISENAYLWNILMELQLLSRTNGVNSASRSMVENIKYYLDEHYADSVTLSTLGNIFYLHPNYIHRIFSEAVGKTPAEYLSEQRLIHSRELLLNRNMTVAEIAGSCGFCNASYFIRKFKEKYEITPKEFRLCATTVTYGQM